MAELIRYLEVGKVEPPHAAQVKPQSQAPAKKAD